jgi:signal transduction histidine kinase
MGSISDCDRAEIRADRNPDMRALDLLNRKGHKIVQVRPGTSLSQTMRLMAEQRVGTVLLIDDAGVLQGIISERDLVRIFTQHGSRALDFPVCDLARRDVIVCHDAATLHDLITLMSNNAIRHLPVMRDGRVAGMISARDVLDAQKDVLMQLVRRQKQALGLALKAKARAEESDHHKTEFLHRMSHELRTPLNAIIGFSGLIASESLGPVGTAKYRDYSGEIGAAGHKLLGIINEILEMSRLEMGDCQSRDQIVDMDEEVRAGLDRFREEAAAKAISLDCRSAAQPTRLIGDREMMRKMLRHLLSNAVKFTPRGGSVMVEISASPSGGAAIGVRDTGPGIPADKIGWVTKPFSCVEDTLTQSNGGAGLGLALTSAMAALHQGSVDIVSRLGSGTTVTLRFPPDRRYVETAAHKRIA